MKPFAVAILLLLSAASAYAGPPLSTDDAGTVAVGKAEIELNGSYRYNKEKTAGVTTKSSSTDAEMKITTGIYRDLGVSLALPYVINERSKEEGQPTSNVDGFGDMTVELKYAFAKQGGVNYAIKPSVILPTGNYSAGLSEDRWQFGGTLIATKEFDEGAFALHANLGYEHHNYRSEEANESTRNTLWAASIAGEATLLEGLTAVIDFGLGSNSDKELTALPVYVLTGARYELNNYLDINAGVKCGLTKHEDDVTVLSGLVIKY